MANPPRQALISRAMEEQGTHEKSIRAVAVRIPAPTFAGRPIGSILAHLGKLREEDIAYILELQEKEQQPFGQTAVKHKFIFDTDVHHALSVQSGYPFVSPDTKYFRKDLRAAYEPFSEHVDSLRSLRSELLNRWLDNRNKALAIVSPSRNEGRSYLAANLAVVFAHTGYRTLLIDADLRYPSQQDIFKTQNRTGLSNLLTKRFSAANILKQVPVFSSMRLILSGPIPPNPSDLLASSVFSVMLSKLKQQFDVIIVDSPCTVYPEVLNIAANVDRVLMVMRRHHTLISAARDVTMRLAGAGNSGKVIGSVLSRF